MNRMQKVLLGLLGGAAAFLMVAVAAGFVWSGMGESRTYDLGHVDSFAVGSVTTVTPRNAGGEPLLGYARPIDGQLSSAMMVHVVRLGDEEFRAFLGQSPHRGCPVPWRGEMWFEGMQGVFRDPCYSSTWAIDGTRLFGPTSRDLDEVGVRVERGRVVLQLDRVTEGTDRRTGRSGDGTPTPAAVPEVTGTPTPAPTELAPAR